jgi:drug/metabolite transporter (DMT)-like permease
VSKPGLPLVSLDGQLPYAGAIVVGAGSLYRLATVSIWVSWIVAARLGLRTSLTPWDITAIRCGVSGLILLPYQLKVGVPRGRLGGSGLAAIVLAGGAPMVLVAYEGLQFAPAAHGASLFTALIPLLVAILAAVVLGETFTVARQIGLALIVTGAFLIVGGAGGTIGSRQNIGHALFIGAAMLWACYTVAMRKAKRASRCCYCRGRIIDHLRASIHDHFWDQSVQCVLA